VCDGRSVHQLNDDGQGWRQILKAIILLHAAVAGAACTVAATATYASHSTAIAASSAAAARAVSSSSTAAAHAAPSATAAANGVASPSTALKHTAATPDPVPAEGKGHDLSILKPLLHQQGGVLLDRVVAERKQVADFFHCREGSFRDLDLRAEMDGVVVA
jgi:hypothetical protein